MENKEAIEENLRRLEHAFWNLIDLASDNLPEADPSEEDPEILSYVSGYHERLEEEKEEFDSAMKEIRKQVGHDEIS